MSFFAITGLMIAIANLSMVIVLMSYKNKTLLHITWMMFCLSAIIWGVGGFLMGINGYAGKALLISKITHIGVIMIPAFFVHFVLEFTKTKQGFIVATNYIIALIFQLLNNYTKIFINKTTLVFDDFFSVHPPTTAYNIFVIWFVGSTILSHIYLYINSRGYDKVKKEQANILILAMLLSFSGGITSFFPVYGIAVYPYGNILASFYPLIITYAIIRYRFFDMRFTAVKTMKYIFLLALSSLTVASLNVIGVLPGNAGGIALGSIIGTGIFLYIRQWPYWEKIFGVSSLLDLQEKVKLVIHSRISFNNIEEVEQFLTDIFQKDDFAKKVKIIKKEEIEQYQDVYDFFLQNKGDVYVGDEQIRIEQHSNKNFAENKGKEISSKLFFPLFVEQNNLGGIVMFEQTDEDQIYNANQIQILKTITPKISLIYEALQFNQKLQQEIHEKTRDLEEKTQELGVSNERLRKIDEEKDIFIGMAAHEMRTPMTIMRGYADMMRTEQCGPLTEQQKVMVQKIIDGNESLMALINDILDLSKIESGKTPFNFETININSVIQELYLSFQGLMAEKKIQFSLSKEINESYPFITDKSKFMLIITNLLSNAYKYTPENGQVLLNAKTIFKESLPYITISVKDSGIGIPKDEIPKLFERFANISTHGNVKTKIQSTGLGLSIVKRIITEMGGDITVESDTDKGAEFIVTLPYNQEKTQS